MSLQETRTIGSTNTTNHRGGGRGQHRGGGRGGRGRGRGRGGRNIYLGSYTPEQWRKLPPEDKKRVQEGRQKSAEQHSQNTNASLNNRTLASIVTNTTTLDSDSQSTLTMPTALLDHQQINNQHQFAEKRPNTEPAGTSMSRRRLNAIKSSGQTISQVRRQISKQTTKTMKYSTCELDSHADTCVAGPNCVVIEYIDQVVDVSAFSDHHDTIKDIPVVTAATAFDDPRHGTAYILILNQALYMADIVETTLLCPNQLRTNGLIVDDVPIHLAPLSRPLTHSIYCPDTNVRLPLSLKGVISYIDTRTPTKEELSTCQWVTLTSDTPWDPHADSFTINEEIASQQEI